MKKILTTILAAGVATCVFAGPHGPRRDHGRGAPPPHRHHDRNDGLALAAGIVNIVGNGLRIFNPPTTTIVTTPVVPVQTVVQPVVQPVVVQQPQPVVVQQTTTTTTQPIIIQNDTAPQYIYIKTPNGIVQYKLN